MLDRLLIVDAALRTWLVTHHTPWLDQVMWLLSAAGVGGSIWIAIAALMASWVPRLRPPAWQVVLAVFLAQDYYNYHRPHGALDAQTPYERLVAKMRAGTSPAS